MIGSKKSGKVFLSYLYKIQEEFTAEDFAEGNRFESMDELHRKFKKFCDSKNVVLKYRNHKPTLVRPKNTYSRRWYCQRAGKPAHRQGEEKGGEGDENADPQGTKSKLN